MGLWVVAMVWATQAFSKNDVAVSLSTAMAGYSFSDEDGKSDQDVFSIPVTLGFEYPMDRLNKLYVAWSMFNESIEATRQGDMGVTLEASQIEASWLHKIRLTHHVKSFLGVGIRTHLIEVTKKHKMDSDGFLAQRFEDSDTTLFSAVLSANADWEIVRDRWHLGTRVAYDIPVGDGLQGYLISIGIKHEF